MVRQQQMVVRVIADCRKAAHESTPPVSRPKSESSGPATTQVSNRSCREVLPRARKVPSKCRAGGVAQGKWPMDGGCDSCTVHLSRRLAKACKLTQTVLDSKPTITKPGVRAFCLLALLKTSPHYYSNILSLHPSSSSLCELSFLSSPSITHSPSSFISRFLKTPLVPGAFLHPVSSSPYPPSLHLFSLPSPGG